MPSLPKHLRMPSFAARAKLVFLSSLNFYRVHLMTFTIIPLIASAIMWGVNTEYHISYIDCLFNCMSAMTVTGLATVNLSTLSPLQQVILFLQMIVGNTIFVSILMIVVRRHFFRSTFKHVVKESQRRRRPSFIVPRSISINPAQPLSAIRRRFSTQPASQRPDPDTLVSPENGKAGTGLRQSQETSAPSSVEMKPVQPSDPPLTDITLQPPPPPRTKEEKEKEKKKKKKKHHITTGMIKRVDGGGVGMVNPMGWYAADNMRLNVPEGVSVETSAATTPTTEEGRGGLELRMAPTIIEGQGAENGEGLTHSHDNEDLLVESPTDVGPTDIPPAEVKTPYAGRHLTDELFPRSKTIAFDDPNDGHDHDRPDRGATTARENAYFPRTATARSARVDDGTGPFPRTGTTTSFPRTYTLHPTSSRKVESRLSGFGGFPTPFELLHRAVSTLAPKAHRTLTQTLTMPRTNTISGRPTMSAESAAGSQAGKEVPYITFSANVGRNSRFRGLTEEQMDELGGVEYRALRVLLYIVIGYFLFMQLAAFVIIAPYINAGHRYEYVFQGQYRYISVPWFALFQAVSAFSNTGMSLIDTSMIPFQTAYLMIFVMFILIFAGNTAYPVFLRMTVWIIYKLCPASSKTKETLKFLLDHPRRCYIYLFPSTQTYVLLIVMFCLTMTDFICFLVLDIGTPVINAIPVGTRIAAGFLQSAAVRAAGFGIIPLGALAPAVKVLYVIMMYISVYPIALSVRSTNVYEEKSLGLFNEEEDSDDGFEGTEEKGAQAVAKYVGWHARRQLAFDIWWLGFALWLVCIIERGHIDKVEDASWFNVFTIMFELVSAYGTVGLSLGVNNDNYSLSGQFRKLSKLVVIAVMLRGRHRGLPVAIDRAVMLPKDFTAAEENAFEEERSRRLSRRASSLNEDIMAFRQSEFANASRHAAGLATAPVFRRDSDTTPPYRRESDTPTVETRHTRTSSHGQGGVPSSPTTLTFSLPSTTSAGAGNSGSGAAGTAGRNSVDRDRQRSPTMTFSGGAGGRGGALSPVMETGLSRGPTRTE